MQIVCHACGAKNRLDAGAVGRPEMTIQCGRCQTALLDGKPVDLSGGGFLGAMVRSMPHDGSAICAGGPEYAWGDFCQN